MLKFLIFGIGVLAAEPAWAGCENYVDGSMSTPAPRAEICFKGECEQTTMEYVCSNADSGNIAFANGWKLSYRMDDGSGRAGLADSADEQIAVLKNGKEVSDFSSVQCRPIDEFGCDGFPL